MARWKLMQPHYLTILHLPDGTTGEWVKEETNRTTGRMARHTYKVPVLLDTNNPQDFNDPDGIIVCFEGKGERNDITFFGNPTPDMEPLDDEAEEITAAAREKWDHPIDSLPANGGMNDKEMAFMERMMKAFGGGQAPAPAVVPNAEVEALKAQVAKLTEMITSQKPERRV
jgi:hypothetical protein